ncbi:AraC family transcriptional regulator [Evansella halocellulosilytica]|uniref:AraC family transcriptional regulator n=1 Tax=Evansella halocellulosilytica TaxID=2011013 RepID=UPI000BB82066|nr:AraC family transcriptional regulator [Evansella halocellulosilytica]
MGWVESIQKAIDYMEKNLLEELTIERIAKEANSSVFHFQRTFSILTNMSVAEYLRGRRLTLAAQELASTNTRIIDLAYKYGYDTPEAFSKAFRRQHGMKPSEVRKNIGELKSYNRLIIQVNLKGAEPMKYRIVERESFQVVGIKREFSCINGENLREIPKFWNAAHKEGTDEALFKLNSGNIKGVLGVCVDKSAKSNGDEIEYWIATEYSGEELPSGFSRLEIPASKWGVFEVHGPMPDSMQNSWKKIFSEWFPSNNYEHAGTPELEVYTSKDPSNPNLYSEIWIPLK